MYSLVNLSVKPSGFIQTAMYMLLTAVLAVSVFYLYKQPLFLVFLIGVVAFYFVRLQQHGFIYQRARQWQIKNGQMYQVETDLNFPDSTPSYDRGFHATKVTVSNLQVWRSLVLFTYQLGQKKYHEIISIDAVDQEAFRQFRCMIKRLT